MENLNLSKHGTPERTTMNKPNNPPAFPVHRDCIEGNIGTKEYYILGGMSLRDWFAGQALIGLLACKGHYIQTQHTCNDGYVPTEVNKMCYEYADAMLAQREVTNG